MVCMDYGHLIILKKYTTFSKLIASSLCQVLHPGPPFSRLPGRCSRTPRLNFVHPTSTKLLRSASSEIRRSSCARHPYCYVTTLPKDLPKQGFYLFSEDGNISMSEGRSRSARGTDATAILAQPNAWQPSPSNLRARRRAR